MAEKFSREWYDERGELEAHDVVYAWIKEQMEIAIAYDVWYAKWGIPCGPPYLPYGGVLMERQLTVDQQRVEDAKKVGIWFVYGWDTMPYPLFIADNREQAEIYQGKVGYPTWIKFWRFGDEFGAY